MKRESGNTLSRLESWLSSRNVKREEKPRPARVRPLRTPLPEMAEVMPEDEVDRILDKISAEGYDALTDEEKHILYQASRR